MNNPLNRQEGGSHYKNYSIQPIEYAMANNLNYCQSNVVKYITRYKDKNGLEDLKKAIHNIEILIELEYGIDLNVKRNGQVQRQAEEGTTTPQKTGRVTKEIFTDSLWEIRKGPYYGKDPKVSSECGATI